MTKEEIKIQIALGTYLSMKWKECLKLYAEGRNFIGKVLNSGKNIETSLREINFVKGQINFVKRQINFVKGGGNSVIRGARFTEMQSKKSMEVVEK